MDSILRPFLSCRLIHVSCCWDAATCSLGLVLPPYNEYYIQADLSDVMLQLQCEYQGDKAFQFLFLFSGLSDNTGMPLIQIRHRHSLGLNDELVRIWWSKIKVTVTSQNTEFLAIAQEFME